MLNVEVFNALLLLEESVQTIDNRYIHNCYRPTRLFETESNQSIDRNTTYTIIY